MDYLVYIAEKILYKNPKYINYLAPLVTYVLTIFAGTGHTAFSMIPVIVEVAKGQNIRPSVPLSIAVVSSDRHHCFSGFRACQFHITGVLEPFWLELIPLSSLFGLLPLSSAAWSPLSS